jgi:protein gp37
MKKTNDHVVIFKTEDEKISVDVRFDEETVWLSLDQMADLFERDISVSFCNVSAIFAVANATFISKLRIFTPLPLTKLCAVKGVNNVVWLTSSQRNQNCDKMYLLAG